MKTFLFRSTIGIFFGGFLAVILTASIILANGLETIDAVAFMKSAVGTMFCAWFFSVTPLYFENENWSLLRQTSYHFITVIILYFFTAFGLQWFSFTPLSFLTFVLMFLGVYAVIWVSFYFYFKNEARKMSEELDGL
ncbi:DUF3021 domain-containing protein [Sporosarcina sp. BI001-red]|uniref:DUF3021 domain-containing protein n=1 Tax=Sporosarcina sp. BI001-red TaxID=2282866 RepID=UPI000E288580|nr:DUF3021 domain-containing protein [Sporosarcina sp. BI001-red]REB07108.1 DUF3021 domain-containing protein [Sporosarcina sp. BI001-red]